MADRERAAGRGARVRAARLGPAADRPAGRSGARPRASREASKSIELALLTAVAAAYGYVLTRPALAGALGRPMSAALVRRPAPDARGHVRGLPARAARGRFRSVIPVACEIRDKLAKASRPAGHYMATDAALGLLSELAHSGRSFRIRGGAAGPGFRSRSRCPARGPFMRRRARRARRSAATRTRSRRSARSSRGSATRSRAMRRRPRRRAAASWSPRSRASRAGRSPSPCTTARAARIAGSATRRSRPNGSTRGCTTPARAARARPGARRRRFAARAGRAPRGRAGTARRSRADLRVGPRHARRWQRLGASGGACVRAGAFCFGARLGYAQQDEHVGATGAARTDLFALATASWSHALGACRRSRPSSASASGRLATDRDEACDPRPMCTNGMPCAPPLAVYIEDRSHAQTYSPRRRGAPARAAGRRSRVARGHRGVRARAARAHRSVAAAARCSRQRARPSSAARRAAGQRAARRRPARGGAVSAARAARAVRSCRCAGSTSGAPRCPTSPTRRCSRRAASATPRRSARCSIAITRRCTGWSRACCAASRREIDDLVQTDVPRGVALGEALQRPRRGAQLPVRHRGERRAPSHPRRACAGAPRSPTCPSRRRRGAPDAAAMRAQQVGRLARGARRAAARSARRLRAVRSRGGARRRGRARARRARRDAVAAVARGAPRAARGDRSKEVRDERRDDRPAARARRELPWTAPDDARREAVRSSLLAAATEDACAPRAGAGRWSAAGFAPARSRPPRRCSSCCTRSHAPTRRRGAARAVVATAAADFERTITRTPTGTDELVRVHAGKVTLAVDPLPPGRSRARGDRRRRGRRAGQLRGLGLVGCARPRHGDARHGDGARARAAGGCSSRRERRGTRTRSRRR